MRILIALLLALPLLGAAAPAPAAPVAVSATLDGRAVSLPEAAAHHCWIPASSRLECYRDPAARDRAIGGTGGTGRRITAASTLATTYATLYENVSYGGASLALIGSVSNLGTYGWNDRASALTVGTGHAVTLFVDAGYAGASRGFSASCADLGIYGLNDQASSVRVDY